jgi:hypothetical protein
MELLIALLLFNLTHGNKDKTDYKCLEDPICIEEYFQVRINLLQFLNLG